MSEIKLTRRYPDSKPEDITDAYMRGVAAGMEIANSQHERRIERIDGMLDGMGRGAASRIEAMEGRIAAIERKLAHKTREDA